MTDSVRSLKLTPNQGNSAFSRDMLDCCLITRGAVAIICFNFSGFRVSGTWHWKRLKPYTVAFHSQQTFSVTVAGSSVASFLNHQPQSVCRMNYPSSRELCSKARSFIYFCWVFATRFLVSITPTKSNSDAWSTPGFLKNVGMGLWAED